MLALIHKMRKVNPLETYVKKLKWVHVVVFELEYIKLMNIMWPTSKITLLCISFIFIKIKFIHCSCYVMFLMNYLSICNN